MTGRAAEIPRRAAFVAKHPDIVPNIARGAAEKAAAPRAIILQIDTLRGILFSEKFIRRHFKLRTDRGNAVIAGLFSP